MPFAVPSRQTPLINRHLLRPGVWGTKIVDFWTPASGWTPHMLLLFVFAVRENENCSSMCAVQPVRKR